MPRYCVTYYAPADCYAYTIYPDGIFVPGFDTLGAALAAARQHVADIVDDNAGHSQRR
jgi:hypothetical protein